MHCNCTFHLRNLRVTHGCPTVEGSESGGSSKTALGSKRCLSRLRDLLIHLREERIRCRMMLGLPACPAPRNQLPSCECSEQGGGFHSSLTLVGAREHMAVNSGSDSICATLPEGGSTAESSSPDDSSLPSDAAVNIDLHGSSE